MDIIYIQSAYVSDTTNIQIFTVNTFKCDMPLAPIIADFNNYLIEIN
jgi:hypothetical protein